MTTLTEEVRAVVPTLTDTDRAAHVFTERPFQIMPSGEGEREYKDVLIYRIRKRQYGDAETDVIPASVSEYYVGRVVNCRRSISHGNGWFLPDYREGDRWYAEGTELNPEPQDGHHYRLLTGDNQLVRYESSTGRWHVILGRGTQPWAPDDFFLTPPRAYYEVLHPETPGHPGLTELLESGELDDLLAPEDSTGNGFLVIDRLHDKAKLTDGVVPRVTVFEDGKLYVGYDPEDTATNHTLYFGRKFPGMEELVYWGTWTSRWGGDAEAPYFDRTVPDTVIWGEAYVAPVTQPSPYATTVEALELEIATRKEGFEAFNDAISELANDQDWCPEYERTMARLGMRGREVHKLRLAIDVTVDLSMTVESASYRVDNAIEAEYGVDSVSSLSFNATANVQVLVVVDRDLDYAAGYDEDASEYLTHENVREAVEDKMQGGAEWSIDDWNADGDAYLADDQEDL